MIHQWARQWWHCHEDTWCVSHVSSQALKSRHRLLMTWSNNLHPSVSAVCQLDDIRTPGGHPWHDPDLATHARCFLKLPGFNVTAIFFVHPTGTCFISGETPIYVSAWALGLGKLDEILPEFPAAAIMYGNSSEEKNSPHPPQQWSCATSTIM